MSDGHGEIVIIRRGGHGDHDEHHGGVWKIAFADFMTAMMAFFLVLWLVSANDKTRASVARYFNPIKLVDATTQPRGLHDSKKDDSGVTASPDTKDKPDGQKANNDTKPKGTSPAETSKGREKRLDAQLRDNPYVALAEIVGIKGPGDPGAQGGTASTPAIGHGGAAFRDPFAPPPASAAAAAAEDDGPPDSSAATQPPPGAKPAQEAKAPKHETKSDETRKAVEDLKTNIVAALKGLDRTGPAVEVQKTSEGTLVSLTDTSDFTMFSNGSAVPSRRVVLMMEKIAQVLKGKPGRIVLRGFTDNKRFRAGRYDNWHLSLDRAQVAHYMLVRGGLADERISHVEGYADHDRRAGVDPASARNRRIEILLKDETR